MLYLSLLRCCFAVAAFALLAGLRARAADAVPATGGVAVPRNFANLPLYFEANAGQTAPEAQFIARGRGFTIYLTRGEAVFALTEVERQLEPDKKSQGLGQARRSQGRAKKTIQNNLRMSFLEANPQPEISGADALSGTVNYFIGGAAGDWRTGIPSFERVLYREIYPGIDLVFYGNQGQLEYDFNLRPGAEPSGIILQLTGAENLALTDGGELIVSLAGGHLRWKAPVAFQEIGGARQPVTCAFTLLAADRIGFSVGAYDRTQPLTIDPLLVYSTYLGGSLQDIAQAVAVDRLGTVFITGQTDSLNFPTNRAFRGTNSGSAEVFVTRLNTNATAFHYSTYVGGSGADIGFGIAVDSGGNAYVAGRTESPNFPTRNANQASLAGGVNSDAFIFKLGTNGTNLIYSSYFGGNDTEAAYGVAVDTGTNNAYIVGETFSGSGFPKKNNNGVQNSAGGFTDAFIAKFNTTSSGGNSLLWASWLGGNDDDIGFAIAADSSEAVYVTGECMSCDFGCGPSFPTMNAFQPNYGGAFGDAFVAKISANPTLLWSTYLGGTNVDIGLGIKVDTNNNVFVAGATSSENFPVTNAFQAVIGDSNGFTADAFLVKFRPSGNSISYGTYLGGRIRDEANALAVDIAGNAWITGVTFSDSFPISNTPLQTSFGGDSDAFVAMFNPNLSGADSLIFSTYLGGGGGEVGTGIGVDTNGNGYVVGQTLGTNTFGRTPGVVQPNYGGGFSDAFVTKVFAAPRIKMVRSGTNHLATWPSYPSGYNLVFRTNANSGSWNGMPGTVTTTNGLSRLTVTNTGPRKFIRLRKP